MNLMLQLPPASGCATRLVPNTLRWAAKLAVTSMALPCALTFAQAADSTPKADPNSGGIIGIGVASVPKYQGSDQTQIKGIPILEYHWANGIFVGGDNDTLIGFQRFGPPELQYGVALGVDEGRRESHASALAGMGNVAIRLTLDSFAKFSITDQLSLNSSVRLGSGNDSKGALLKLGTAYTVALSQSTQLSFNLGATMANASYMENYFGVSTTQASKSGYRIYTPSGGVRDVSVGMRLSRQINRDWSVLAGISSTSLYNAAKDSPLVRQANTQKVLLGVAYSIGQL